MLTWKNNHIWGPRTPTPRFIFKFPKLSISTNLNHNLKHNSDHFCPQPVKQSKADFKYDKNN